MLAGSACPLYNGASIGCTIEERANVILNSVPSSPGVTLDVLGCVRHVQSVEDMKLAQDDADMALAVLKALELDPQTVKPFSLEVQTDLPVEGGVAGRSAIIIAVTAAVLQHVGLRLNMYELAELSYRIESDILGCFCGYMTHYTIVFGGMSYIVPADKSARNSKGNSHYFATMEPLAVHIPDDYPLIAGYWPDGPVYPHFNDIEARWNNSDRQIIEIYEEMSLVARDTKHAMLSGQWTNVATLLNDYEQLGYRVTGANDAYQKGDKVLRSNGALSVNLSGPGHGATLVAVTYDKQATAEAMLAGGACQIFHPKPFKGIQLEYIM